MPKIRKNHSRIVCEGTPKGFEYDIMYSKRSSTDSKKDLNYFNIKIPAEYIPAFDLLSKEERQKFSCDSYTGKRDYNSRDIGYLRNRLVYADTEVEVIKNFEALMLHLIQQVITTRRVIIIYTDDDSHGGESVGNDFYGRSSVGINFGFKYLEESQIGESKKSYARVNGNGTKNEEYVHPHNKLTIIDDTPENRVFLETLHDALTKLSATIMGVTKTSEALLTMINSGQKLIS